MEKTIYNIKNNPILFLTIVMFVFFLIISFFTPIAGDDWGNVTEGSEGIIAIWNGAVDMYKFWEGRFISRLFISILTYNKFIWNFFNAFMMAGAYYFILKIVNPKNKLLIGLLLILGFIIIDRDIFLQTYLWLAGNLTYMIPIFLILFYLLYINRIFESDIKNINRYKFIGLIIFNFLCTMFVENAAACLIFINIITVLYNFYKYKKINIQLILFLISSIIGFALMYFSPGNAARLTETATFNELSLIKKIIFNIPYFIEWTFRRNMVTIVLSAIVMNYIIIKRFRGISRISLIIFTNFIPIIEIGIIIINLFTWILDIEAINLIRNSKPMSIYWLLYGWLFIYLIISLLKGIKKDKVIFYLAVAISSNVAMFLSPIWGGRTAALTMFLLYIPILILIGEIPIKVKKEVIINKVLIRAVSIIIFVFFIAYYNLLLASNYRNESIETQVLQGNDEIVISELPYYLIHCSSPESEFHIRVFKQYYNIPEEVNIRMVESNWKMRIIYEESEEVINAINYEGEI